MKNLFNVVFFLSVSMSPIILGAFAHSLDGWYWYVLAYTAWIFISMIGEMQRLNLEE